MGPRDAQRDQSKEAKREKGQGRFTSESSLDVPGGLIREHCLKPPGTLLDQQEQTMEQ
jgi:hypothetical protein